MNRYQHAILKAIQPFRCIRLHVKARARQEINLPPYRGSSLRGALGIALLRNFCMLREQRCSTCPLRNRCVYSYIFETPSLSQLVQSKRYRSAPHPFVLNVGTNQKEKIAEGESFSFGMTLIGNGIQFLPHIISAFQRMGQIGIGRGRGQFEVAAVDALDASGQVFESIYRNGSFKKPDRFLGLADAEKLSTKLPNHRICLKLETPLRMVYEGKVCREPEFHIILGNLFRRLQNLSIFHCQGENGACIDNLLLEARAIKAFGHRVRWYDWERYSKRQDRRMKLGGLVGEVYYEGNLTPFLPMLILGSWVNLGKNTSFGLGRYCIRAPHDN